MSENGHPSPVARAIVTVAAMLAALIAIPAASASEVQVTSDSLLRIDAPPGERNLAQVSFVGLPTEADPLGRFVISDKAGVAALSPQCVALSSVSVTCGAQGVTALAALLGDEDDDFVLGSGGKASVPARFSSLIKGEEGADVIRGAKGADRVYGGAGRDTVAGGGGADRLFGGPGRDGVLGFGGNDTLLGGSGTDVLFGMKGKDSMQGRAGSDFILATDGKRDTLIDCGAGDGERAVTDRFDPKPKRC